MTCQISEFTMTTTLQDNPVLLNLSVRVIA